MRPVLCIIALSLLVLPMGLVSAAVFSVTTGVDQPDQHPGDSVCESGAGCTLRAAVQEANALPGADTIQVSIGASPIRILLGPVTVADNCTVIAGDGGLPVIDGIDNIFEAPSLLIRADSCVVTGLWFRRSRGDALRVEGAWNRIGGLSASDRVLFTANGLDKNDAAAVKITGTTASDNQIIGCLIGSYGNGMMVDGNEIGVTVTDSARNNYIGDTTGTVSTIVVDNARYGVWITGGAYGTVVSNCHVGILADGVSPSGNGWGGIRIDGGARRNHVGGSSESRRCLVGGNSGNGITLAGPTTAQNRIHGCHIGLDINGLVSVGNRGAGVAILGASDNTVGGSSPGDRNLISSNRGDGVLIAGSEARHNLIAGNYVGVDVDGRRTRGNGLDSGHGITVTDGASRNTIGGNGPLMRNVVSGQLLFGIMISGAHDNTVAGNFVGCNSDGTFSVPNGAGIVACSSATGNTIGGSTIGERNLISGNWGDIFPYGSGLMLLDPGTTGNAVLGNFIGTDTSGARSVPNREAGVLIGQGASNNYIGGSLPGEGNVISGNGFGTLLPTLGRGIHVFGTGTVGNRIAGNRIGTTADGTAALRNYGHGIAVLAGAENTVIGGTDVTSENRIARNSYHGIYIADRTTRFTTIRFNVIGPNDSTSIVIADSAQESIAPPQLIAATIASVSGHSAPPGGTVDFYATSSGVLKAGASAVRYVAGAVADHLGNFSASVIDVHPGDSLTAIATDVRGNSSALAVPVAVAELTDVADVETLAPASFALFQNFPNPFNPSTTIRYTLPHASPVELEIVNVLGQRVRTLVRTYQPAGEYSIEWDGSNDDGEQVAGGVYLYRLSSDQKTVTRKMLLLK